MKLVRNCVRSECPSWEYPNRVGIDESEAERRSSCSYQQTSNHGVEPIKLYRHHPGHCLARRSWRRQKRPFLLGRRSLSRRVALKTYKFIHDAGHSNLSPGLWPKEVAVRKGCLASPPLQRPGRDGACQVSAECCYWWARSEVRTALLFYAYHPLKTWPCGRMEVEGVRGVCDSAKYALVDEWGVAV